MGSLNTQEKEVRDMPFVDNENAYVTGKVPWHHRRRLNGPKEDYSKWVLFIGGVSIAASIAIVGCGLLYFWRPGRDIRVMVMAGVALAAFFSMPVWLCVNPRMLNRQTWNDYRETGRLFVPSDVAFRFVMMPEVVQWCRSSSVVAQQVDQFLEWCVEQLTVGDEIGPIMRSEASLLRDLCYKLQMDVAMKLPIGQQPAVTDHIGKVIAELRNAYHGVLTADIEILEKRIEGLEKERSYQNEQMVHAV